MLGFCRKIRKTTSRCYKTTGSQQETSGSTNNCNNINNNIYEPGWVFLMLPWVLFCLSCVLYSRKWKSASPCQTNVKDRLTLAQTTYQQVCKKNLSLSLLYSHTKLLLCVSALCVCIFSMCKKYRHNAIVCIHSSTCKLQR